MFTPSAERVEALCVVSRIDTLILWQVALQGGLRELLTLYKEVVFYKCCNKDAIVLSHPVKKIMFDLSCLSFIKE